MGSQGRKTQAKLKKMGGGKVLMSWDQLKSWEGPHLPTPPPSLGTHATQPGVGCKILCTTLSRPDPEGHGLLTPGPLFPSPTLQDSLDQ